MAEYRDGKIASADSLRPVLARQDIFGIDLYKAGMAEEITGLFNEMNGGPWQVRKVIHDLRKGDGNEHSDKGQAAR